MKIKIEYNLTIWEADLIFNFTVMLHKGRRFFRRESPEKCDFFLKSYVRQSTRDSI